MSQTLLEFCKRNTVTVSDVARAAGLDPKWLYKVAKGERGFSLETAAKIERATSFAVTLTDLNEVRQKWLAARGGGDEGSPTPPVQKKSKNQDAETEAA